MDDDFDLLYLNAPVGKGQENNPDDVEALDDKLRKIGVYSAPPEYADNPQRYATEPMIGALEHYQEQNGLKIDGIAHPGGPTERAINNGLLKKPRGAGLLYDPPAALAGTVGNGFENRREDVASVQRRLGALSHLAEDPFDNPRGFIDEATTNGIKAFQRAKGLVDDGWLAPRGETERALDNAVSDLARLAGSDWIAFAERAGRAQQAFATKLHGTHDDSSSANDGGDAGEITLAYAPGTTSPPPPPRTGPGRSQQSRPFQHPGLFGIDPRYLPPPQPRWSGPMPRDLEFRNPREPHTSQYPQPLRTRVPLEPPTRETGPISVDDLDRALRREPLPSPDKLRTYVPDPGSPLGIPLLDFNPFGSPGDPRTVDANRILAEAIEKGCKQALGDDATVTHFAGPGSTKQKERAVKRSEGREGPSFSRYRNANRI